MTDAQIWQRLYALTNECQPRISKSTICLYGFQNGLKQNGTAILLRVADKHFLVSAAHVLDFTFYHSFQYFTTSSYDENSLFRLKFISRQSSAKPPNVPSNSPQLRDDDPIDISVAELSPETVQELQKGKHFLQLADLDGSELRTAAGIIVFGYPTDFSISKPDFFESFPLPFVTTILQHPPEQRDANAEILLYYPATCTDANETAMDSPDPRGLSGCGIWRLSQPPTHPDLWNVDDIRLVGIQHRWRSRKRYLVGSSIRHVINMIWFSYPDLRSSIELTRTWSPKIELPS